jgi:hypothetical protein
MTPFGRRVTLDELAIRHGTDKSSLLNRFTARYVPYLEPRRDQPLTLLEIGVATGASLRMWRDYFERARIHGADVREDLADRSGLGDRVAIHHLDQADAGGVEGLVCRIAAESGGLDIVVDDGSHFSSHQILTFKTIFPLLRPGGLYFVEDVTTSYRAEPYGGGLGRPDTFLRFALDLVHFIPMSMGSVPPREPWEHDVDMVHFHGHGGLVVVGKPAVSSSP